MAQLFNHDGKWMTLEQVNAFKQRQEDEKKSLEELVEKVEEIGEPPLAEGITCDICGKVCKSNLGLASHKRFNHK